MKYFILILAFAISYSLYAQNDASVSEQKNEVKPFSYGLIFGLNFSKYKGDSDKFINAMNNELSSQMAMDINYEPQYRKFMLPIGMTVGYNFTPWIGIHTGVLLSPKGMKYHGKTYVPTSTIGYDQIYEMHEKLTYLDFPVYVEISPQETWQANAFYFNFGITPSVLISSRLVSKSWTVQLLSASETDIDKEKISYINTSDLGWTFGFGYRIDMFKIGMSFTNGLKDIYESSAWDIRNSMFAIHMQLRFNYYNE